MLSRHSVKLVSRLLGSKIKTSFHNLHLRSFKTPPSGAVMSDEDDADCAFLYYVRNAQRCKIFSGVNPHKNTNLII